VLNAGAISVAVSGQCWYWLVPVHGMCIALVVVPGVGLCWLCSTSGARSACTLVLFPSATTWCWWRWLVHCYWLLYLPANRGSIELVSSSGRRGQVSCIDI
jgi:hypothetical protein